MTSEEVGESISGSRINLRRTESVSEDDINGTQLQLIEPGQVAVDGGSDLAANATYV
jgi:hypothetical protein